MRSIPRPGPRADDRASRRGGGPRGRQHTVRRTSGPWTPTIHAFLRHLRAAGVTAVPGPLGIDDRGREIMSLLPGAPATYPLPDFAWSDATLHAVAGLLRAFHDASAGFVAPPGGRWQW